MTDEKTNLTETKVPVNENWLIDSTTIFSADDMIAFLLVKRYEFIQHLEYMKNNPDLYDDSLGILNNYGDILSAHSLMIEKHTKDPKAQSFLERIFDMIDKESSKIQP